MGQRQSSFFRYVHRDDVTKESGRTVSDRCQSHVSASVRREQRRGHYLHPTLPFPAHPLSLQEKDGKQAFKNGFGSRRKATDPPLGNTKPDFCKPLRRKDFAACSSKRRKLPSAISSWPKKNNNLRKIGEPAEAPVPSSPRRSNPPNRKRKEIPSGSSSRAATERTSHSNA